MNEKAHMPNLLQLAVIFSKYDDVFIPTSPPRAVQKILFAVLAPIGKLLGYRPEYPYPYARQETKHSVAG